MNDTMIRAQGDLYTPEELVSAYAERGERIEEQKQVLRRLEGRNAELETVAEAVMTLVNFAAKGEDPELRSDLDDLRSDLNELRSDLEDLRSDLEGSDLEDIRSDLDETRSKLDSVVSAMRDAAAELATV